MPDDHRRRSCVCSPYFPSVEPAYVYLYVLESTDSLAVSPDGTSIILNDFTNIDLHGRAENHPFDTYIPADSRKDALRTITKSEIISCSLSSSNTHF